MSVTASRQHAGGALSFLRVCDDYLTADVASAEFDSDSAVDAIVASASIAGFHFTADDYHAAVEELVDETFRAPSSADPMMCGTRCCPNSSTSSSFPTRKRF